MTSKLFTAAVLALCLGTVPAAASLLEFRFSADVLIEDYDDIPDPYPGNDPARIDGRVVIDRSVLPGPAVINFGTGYAGAIDLVSLTVFDAFGAILGEATASGGSVDILNDKPNEITTVVIGLVPGTGGQTEGLNGLDPLGLINGAVLYFNGEGDAVESEALSDLTVAQLAGMLTVPKAPFETGTGLRLFAIGLDPGSGGIVFADDVIDAGLTSISVPLPPGLALLLTGIAALGWARCGDARRRRTTHTPPCTQGIQA